ncbi:MAG: sodium-dependent transporter [Ignavibacteriae bacterium]|nr:sodium-dependent transporter [Ignavibacteriota bacterium]NOG98669.1 sodium-dependent transporter [Ignavibacteriota bacterium]
MSVKTSGRENWGSKVGFILAAAGSAIGLGNIWKFPYIAGENGGAAFIFIYLICIAVIGLPVLIAEVLLGRTTQRNPVGAFKALSNSPYWTAIGAMGVIAGFVILSFYGVVAGWSFGYIFEAIKGSFYEFEQPNSAADFFGSLTSNVAWIVGFLALFMCLTMFIVYSGVQKGIERGSKILMPLLLIILIILMIKGITLDGSEKGIAFILQPDWSLVSGESVLLALGHAFFTLSLGMGAMMTYGSYMSKKDSIPGASLQIVFLDTFIALIAGVAIFTAVFATGLDPAAGPGLIFQTLPVVFTKMPGGYIFSIMFFLLLTIAALTSSISLLEVVVAYFVDEKKWARKKAVIVFGTVTFLVGVPSALSFNLIADVKLFGLNFFDLADWLASNILLPVGGLFISVFVAWVWGFDKVLVELKRGAESLFDNYPWIITFWKIFIKYFSPVLIFLVFLHSIGVLDLIIDLFK